MTSLAPSFLIGSSSFIAGNKDNYESLEEVEFQAEPTADCRVNYP